MSHFTTLTSVIANRPITEGMLGNTLLPDSHVVIPKGTRGTVLHTLGKRNRHWAGNLTVCVSFRRVGEWYVDENWLDASENAPESQKKAASRNAAPDEGTVAQTHAEMTRNQVLHHEAPAAQLARARQVTKDIEALHTQALADADALRGLLMRWIVMWGELRACGLEDCDIPPAYLARLERLRADSEAALNDQRS